MRSLFAPLIVFAMVAVAGVPAIGDQPEGLANGAREIHGKIIDLLSPVVPGTVFSPGPLVMFEFKYETSTPGEVQARVEAMVAGKVSNSVRSSAFELKNRTGNGELAVYVNASDDQVVDELRIVLTSKSGVQSDRVAATIKGPVRFQGDPRLGALAPRSLLARIDPTDRDHLLVKPHYPQSAKGKKNEKEKTEIRVPPATAPEIKILIKEVQVFGRDGKRIEAKQLSDLLEKPQTVLAMSNAKANPAAIKLPKEYTLLLLMVPSALGGLPRQE